MLYEDSYENLLNNSERYIILQINSKNLDAVEKSLVEDLNITEYKVEGDLDLSQYLGQILVETAMPFPLLTDLQTPVELDNQSNYGFDFDYRILQCS